ncbi:chromatin assembly factor-I (CAF-I) p90 subunit [Didymella heteroderae]|uniref:Chromatin assembly factor-I (CAF-I) p90 subunit n=1 Tax=Didymella heteroderae TaxID=1769908 RepID=A0A9P4WK66_9PLEO|nr:chromatin assembly factor-I (CAF-I) p90 subunit [Didymella heteroderae]
MEDPTPVVPLVQKRPREEDAEPQPSTPVKAISSQASTPLSVLSNIQTPSPVKLSVPSTPAPTNSTAAKQTSTQTAPSTSNTQQPVKKKRKVLTQQEKDDAAREREAKAKVKADKAAQKEAEAKLKADEKAQKAAQKEAESKAKAEERAKREEEKAKKERSQMKLNAFFVKPIATASRAEPSVVDSNPDSTAPLPTSLPSDTTGVVANGLPPSPQMSIQKNAHSDYERCFLPFSLPSTAILASSNAFMEDTEKLNAARARLDQLCKGDKAGLTPLTTHTLKVSLPARARRGLKIVTVKDVVKRVHGSPDRPIDLTNDGETCSQQPLEMLKAIPMKYLHFSEDVRPPYYGTYTKFYSAAVERRLARNFTFRLRQDTNYDYDSEAEWEEPEEGEDLDSDGEDDLEEEGDDDMDGFLDDEEDPQVKRRMLSGDLDPVSTGLCWEDTTGISKLNDGSGAICTDFKDFKMEFLLGKLAHIHRFSVTNITSDPYPQSIDPFSTAYWAPPVPIVTATCATANKSASTNGLMQPPARLLLAQRTMNGMLNTLNSSSTPSASASKPATPKKMVPDDQLPAFKAEIQGKDLTKLGMIEALKKAFPKLPKAAIINTLSVVAARVGPTEKDKRWVLINS